MRSTTFRVEMGHRDVVKGFGLATAMEQWLSNDEIAREYGKIPLLQLIAKLTGVEDKAYATSAGYAERIEAGSTYLGDVSKAGGVDAIELDEQVAGGINNAVNAIAAPYRLTDERQKEIWNPKQPIATESDIVRLLNAFGQTEFVANGCKVVGARILAVTAGFGTAEGKALRRAYTLTATGSLTPARLREIGTKLPVEGSRITDLGADTRAVMGSAERVAFGKTEEVRA